MTAALMWFRNDLRVRDNAALRAAADSGLPVIPLYIYAPEEAGAWSPGAASRWWLHHSLHALHAELQARRLKLIVRGGDTLTILADLIARHGIAHVFWNRSYEPALRARDRQIEKALTRDGVQTTSFHDGLWFEPDELAVKSGGPYRVFTPFWRNALARLPEKSGTITFRGAKPYADKVESMTIAALGLLPKIPWDHAFKNHWEPGERGARRRFSAFLDSTVATYGASRDLPAEDGTSRLSPHLHFGEISPRQILEAVLSRGIYLQAQPFLRQLGWREFAHHILYHFPETAHRPFNPAFERFPWAKPNRALISAWQRGKTGIPLVDAGMRQLWETGWMHNRVRMIAASLLTKNLRQHWLVGAHWFWDTLVDADLANNSLGWQWVAGCGVDASPYFRIFNPTTQAKSFDPCGEYIKRWIPELRALPAAYVHEPWMLRPVDMQACGLENGIYLRPIVDPAQTRERALSAYRSFKSGAKPASAAF